MIGQSHQGSSPGREGLGDGSSRLWSAGGAALPTFGVPRRWRSDGVAESMSQPSRAGLKFGYRPYGPRSDSRSIFEFPHRLFRAGLMFGYRPYGPGSDLRFIAGYHTPSVVLGCSQPSLRDSIWTRLLLPVERGIGSYSDLVEEVDGAALGVLSVLAAGALSDVPPLSAGAELPSELLPPSCDLPDAAGLAA